MHYLLIEKFHNFENHDKLKSQIYELPGATEGYHNGLINLLKRDINVRDRNFSKNFSKLKDNRIKADYSKNIITKQEIETAKELLEKLITKI